jgi:hypothetical protein
MIVAVSIIALLLLVFFIGRMSLSVQFSKEVKNLFAQSKDISLQIYHQQQILDLPDPVQRYFNRVLKNRQPYISYARIKHGGQFKTAFNKPWINIQGEQYATTEKPGFIWKGTTKLFTARDMFIEDTGRLVVSLFSVFNIVDGKGPNYNQGELLRWLGESVMYPTNLLPGERLTWSPVDAQHAKLIFNYNGLSLNFLITFNEIGEIVQMETKRFMGETDLQSWVIKVADYKEMNQVLVPTTFEVLWRLEKGDFSYAKFNITEIEYNKAERF